ncbi:hypothetical protein [Clostridium intestinale]|uniref:Uncharacterized protein n=1 Tax=Clostridium intestinale URNW TaxID=1294142 RepID=U2PV00_9CLOT|nr:hypothetical protein [Clostridium intestinale]ERK30270.1 hypothetical protein CINTURNW_2017 [Clostridium intestinale URNW]
MSKKRVILYIIAISNLIGGIIGSLFMYQSIKNNLVVNWTDISINTSVKVIIFIISILFCLSPILIFTGKRKALLIFYIINISNILFEIITFIRAKYFIEDVEVSNSSGIPIIKILIFVYLIKNELDEHNLKVGNNITY